jgi:hypothetical protein
MGVIGTLVEIVYILVFYLTVHELQFKRRKKLKISAGLKPRTLDYQSYILPLPYLCLHVIECCLLPIWEGGGDGSGCQSIKFSSAITEVFGCTYFVR